MRYQDVFRAALPEEGRRLMSYIAKPHFIDGELTTIGFHVPEPQVCPVCLHNLHPKPVAAYVRFEGHPGNSKPAALEVAFACPRKDCQRLFIARFTANTGTTPIKSAEDQWILDECIPTTFQERIFDPVIATVSPHFQSMYGQASRAEHDGLDLICGAGYRKSLEFLVKDYANGKDASRAEEIKKMALANCIAEFAKDPRVKSMAERATWLGNDETHYVRKWPDKDLKDLKSLIDLTVHWIIAEVLTEQLEKSMPNNPKKAVASP